MRELRILQAHNQHATRGGADAVLDLDRTLLESSGHQVHRLLTAPGAGTSWRDGLRTVWNPDSVRELDRLIDELSPDVVHVHTPFPMMSPAVLVRARHRGIPTVVTSHSFRFACPKGTLLRDGRLCEDCVGRVVKLPAVRHRCYHDSVAASAALATSLSVHRAVGTFRHVDRFLAMTEFGRDVLLRDGVPAARVRVRPNCVPDPGAGARPSERPHRVLFVGRLVDEKGVRTLLKSWRLHAPASHQLRVAGDGPLRTEVTRAAAADPSIVPLGWLDPDRLHEELADARVAVVPSEWHEAGPPLTLLDALASGTPVVASDLANVSATAAAAGAARVFRTGDPVSLARALAETLADLPALDRRGAAARALYERDHTPAAGLRALESTYADVLREAATR